MIKVFTTESCIYCHALLDWLDDQHVKYQEINAVTSEEALERGISSVPVTIIEGADGQETKIVGFDRPALKKALKTLAV